MSEQLLLERREQVDATPHLSTPAGGIMMTPPIDEAYWSYRVRLSETQAIVGFPKFSTVGIGFAHEEDWNTNLPYSTPAAEIFEHIAHNKGDDGIDDSDVLEAIRLVQAAVVEDRARAGLPAFHRPAETPDGYLVCASCDELVPFRERGAHACPDADTLAEIDGQADELTVYVVAFQHRLEGEGVGGFDWRETRAEVEAIEAEREATGFYGPEYEHAIFPFRVPAGLSNDEITEYVDGDYIDELCKAVA